MARKRKRKDFQELDVEEITGKKQKRIHGSYLGKKQYEEQLEEAGEYPTMTKRRADEMRRKKKKKKYKD